jgi:predicted HTH transcriptional regulator
MNSPDEENKFNFIKDSYFPYENTTNLIFIKNSSDYNLLEKIIVSLLNTYGGEIFIGIDEVNTKDEEKKKKKIYGIKLKEKEIDLLICKLDQIQANLIPQIKGINIIINDLNTQNLDKICDHYVIRIIVPKSDIKILSKDKIYYHIKPNITTYIFDYSKEYKKNKYDKIGIINFQDEPILNIKYHYFKGNYFPLKENNMREFKNYCPCSICLEKYVCAFSNTNGGIIYLGISDNRKINGITVINKIKIDKIINELSQLTIPNINNITHKYHNIYDNNYNLIKNLYIITIHIPKSNIEILASDKLKYIKYNASVHRCNTENEIFSKNDDDDDLDIFFSTKTISNLSKKKSGDILYNFSNTNTPNLNLSGSSGNKYVKYWDDLFEESFNDKLCKMYEKKYVVDLDELFGKSSDDNLCKKYEKNNELDLDELFGKSSDDNLCKKYEKNNELDLDELFGKSFDNKLYEKNNELDLDELFGKSFDNKLYEKNNELDLDELLEKSSDNKLYEKNNELNLDGLFEDKNDNINHQHIIYLLFKVNLLFALILNDNMK